MSTSRASSARPYHHGHLGEALVEAGVALARTSGPDAVVLRAVTREAGVSPNAAYRHFADRDDLLRAVAERCQDKMAALSSARLAELPSDGTPVRAWDRLRAAGRAYVDFAVAEPGWFHTAFAIPLSVDPVPKDEVSNLFDLLVGCLDELLATGRITAAARENAEMVAWSSVHGLSTLLAGGTLSNLPEADREAAINRVLDAVAF